MAKEPFICTPEKPWKKEFGFPVQHTNAQENGEARDGFPGGDLQPMYCPDCGAFWTKELPQ